jgi:uncharacterized membrane protein YbhN (UPF0104 family)
MNKRWLQIALGAILLGLLLWRTRVWELGDTLREFSLGTGIIVVLLNLPAITILAFRTRLVLRRLGYDASTLSLIPISAVGNVAAVVTPGATGEGNSSARWREPGGEVALSLIGGVSSSR